MKSTPLIEWGMYLIFEEGSFLVKTLTTSEELEESFRLRHEVFCKELMWVPESKDGCEMDFYDSFSERIGVFDPSGVLAGHARLILPPNRFMVDKEFRALLPEGYIVRKGADSAEVTRLCVRKGGRAPAESVNVSHLLYKGIYQWSLGNGIRHLIMVVEMRYYRLLRLNGFPVEAANRFVKMPDGVRAAVITLDWRRFEEEAGRDKPAFLEWMSKISVPIQARSQWHAFY